MGLEAQLPFAPLRFKELAVACDISQGEIATALDVSKATINQCLNKGYVPHTIKNFRKDLETYCQNNAAAIEWMEKRGLTLLDLWKPAEQGLRKAKPAGQGDRQRRGHDKVAAMIPGDPNHIDAPREVAMLSQGAMKHFKLFSHPFINDVLKASDIFMSDEHRYIEAAMLDAARHGGFLAVVGQVGSGKSVMRRKVIAQLKEAEDVLVIYPQTIDKQRLTSGAICDAIILDISQENPKRSLESKSRQVQRLLLDRTQNGYRHVLIIEEAHDLSVPVLKYLKRFHEMEDGYKKMLGIIMIAQTELKSRFEESQNVDMREVIQRVQIAEIKGLNGTLKGYLEVKFKRLNRKIEDIFTEDAYAMLSRRLTSELNISLAHPLRVNDYVVRGMNLAFELGEDRVSADVIAAL